jgi:hypothetical protein
MKKALLAITFVLSFAGLAQAETAKEFLGCGDDLCQDRIRAFVASERLGSALNKQHIKIIQANDLGEKLAYFVKNDGDYPASYYNVTVDNRGDVNMSKIEFQSIMAFANLPEELAEVARREIKALNLPTETLEDKLNIVEPTKKQYRIEFLTNSEGETAEKTIDMALARVDRVSPTSVAMLELVFPDMPAEQKDTLNDMIVQNSLDFIRNLTLE